MSQSDGRCKTCKHWRDMHVVYDIVGEGLDAAYVGRRTMPEVTRGHCANRWSVGADPDEWRDDCLHSKTESSERLVTGANFGCVHHEPISPPPLQSFPAAVPWAPVKDGDVYCIVQLDTEGRIRSIKSIKEAIKDGAQ